MVMALLVLFLVSVSLTLLAFSLQIRMRLAREDAESVILSALSDAAVDEAVAGSRWTPPPRGRKSTTSARGRSRARSSPWAPGCTTWWPPRSTTAASAWSTPRSSAAAGEVYVRNWRRVPG